MIPNPHPGIFIAFEGIDGCGKTVQLGRTEAWLNSFTGLGCSEGRILSTKKFFIKLAKEPGKERFYGKKIYADLTNKNADALHKKDPYGFQAWYACDSRENLMENIVPALQTGSVVLCDRFRPSMVYGVQTLGDQQTLSEVSALMALNQAIIGNDFIWPDLILIFNIAVDAAIQRLKNKNKDLDEYEKSAVLTIVRKNYLLFDERYPNCRIVNGEKTEEGVFEDVKKLVLPVIEAKGGSLCN